MLVIYVVLPMLLLQLDKVFANAILDSINLDLDLFGIVYPHALKTLNQIHRIFVNATLPQH